MSNNYLIDGYNLLHALGLPPGKLGPRGLEKARGRLIAHLSSHLKERASCATVVFDARKTPRDGDTHQVQRGVHVLYAVEYASADELIEELIRTEATPRQLAVVSDDHRVRAAGKRRRCRVLSCDEFLSMLERPTTQPKAAKELTAEKEAPAEDETRYWLEEFADLVDDPKIKKQLNPFDPDDFTD
jgi:predicted RNA-binding protein with PIN domain